MILLPVYINERNTRAIVGFHKYIIAVSITQCDLMLFLSSLIIYVCVPTKK